MSVPIGVLESAALVAARGDDWRFQGASLDALDLAWLRETLADAARFETLPYLHSGPFSWVARAHLSCGPVVIKRYRYRGLSRLRTFARRSLAQREARALACVGAVLPGSPVRALAWGERRWAGCVAESCLVTNEWVGSCDLREPKRRNGPERRAMADAVLAGLPPLVARLHAGGVFARTLRGKNVLLDPASGRLGLIDLPRARFLRSGLAPRHRVYDLACLSIELCRFLGDREWRRFLADYRREAGLAPGEAARVGERRIARRAARIAHRTPLSSARRDWERRFRHSAVGGRLLSRERPAKERTKC